MDMMSEPWTWIWKAGLFEKYLPKYCILVPLQAGFFAPNENRWIGFLCIRFLWCIGERRRQLVVEACGSLAAACGRLLGAAGVS